MKPLRLLLLVFLLLGLMPGPALAGAPSDHDCVSYDGDLWCDLCDHAMEHDCFSYDGNVRCDLCDALIKHHCYDRNRDGSCDLCTRPCDREYILGDTTGDGKVNMADVAKLYAHIRGTSLLTSPADLAHCDITGEGRINLSDVAKLYAHATGAKPF